MPLYEWIDELSCGWRDETTIADAGDTSKAAESPSPAKNNDSTDVEKGDKGKAAESASLVETKGTLDINAVDNRQAVKPVPRLIAMKVYLPTRLTRFKLRWHPKIHRP